MSEERANNVVYGALLLTIAGLLSKVLSATYRIPLQNLTGDLGFYIYQQVYPFIGTVMILALYGFPVAISKMTAEHNQQQKQMTYTSFYVPLFAVLMVINGLLFALLYILAPSLAVWVGDEGLVGAFRLAAISFLLIPFLSLLRGVSQGLGNMKQTAYSQVVEQLIRVAVIIFASYLVVREKIAIYQIGEFGVLATIAGMLVAISLLIWCFPKKKPSSVVMEKQQKIPWKYYFTTCLTLGVIASANHLILLLMQMVDMLTLVPNLMSYGLPSIAAMEAKGIFDRGQPLIQFGVVIGSSFALALIPDVVRKQAVDVQRQSESIRDGLLFSFYLALGATVGLFFLMKETNVFLFTNSDGTGSLQILSLTIIFTSITITAAAVLQSLGYLKWIAYCILAAIICKWFLNIMLVPMLGISGSALATVASILFLCTVIVMLLHKKLPAVQFLHHVSWGPLVIAIGGMVLHMSCVRYIWMLFVPETRMTLLMYLGIVVSTGALLYLVLLLRYNVLTDKQIQALPFSTKIMTIKEKVQKKGKGVGEFK